MLAQPEAEAQAREDPEDAVAPLTADSLREHAGAFWDAAEKCRKTLMLGEDAGVRKYLRACEAQLRFCEVAIAVCEEAGAERLGDVEDWPGKLRSALG